MKGRLQRPPAETPGIYRTEDSDADSRMVHAHYFTVTGAHWYVLEYSPNLDIAFGWAEILPGCGEYGSFLLSELEEVQLSLPIQLSSASKNQPETINIEVRVEHDDNWKIIPMKEALERHRGQYLDASELEKKVAQRFPFPRL